MSGEDISRKIFTKDRIRNDLEEFLELWNKPYIEERRSAYANIVCELLECGKRLYGEEFYLELEKLESNFIISSKFEKKDVNDYLQRRKQIDLEKENTR